MLLDIGRGIILGVARAVHGGALFAACDGRAGFVGRVLRAALGLSALFGLGAVGLSVWWWWAFLWLVH